MSRAKTVKYAFPFLAMLGAAACVGLSGARRGGGAARAGGLGGDRGFRTVSRIFQFNYGL